VPELWTLAVLRVMNFMRFQFLGESVPELTTLPPKERRQLYYRAALHSYKDWQTWLGIVVFIGAIIFASSFQAEPVIFSVLVFLGGWFLLRLQLLAVRHRARLLLHEPHAS
jgi:hypothetical protein